MLKDVQPYTARHENQNLSTYLIMLSKTQTSACYLFPASNKYLSLNLCHHSYFYFSIVLHGLTNKGMYCVHYSSYTNTYKHMVEEAKSTQPSIIQKKWRTCRDQLKIELIQHFSGLCLYI